MTLSEARNPIPTINHQVAVEEFTPPLVGEGYALHPWSLGDALRKGTIYDIASCTPGYLRAE